jgi:hypothetical protein
MSNNKIPEVVWEATYGLGGIEFYPMCPYCGELAYQDDECYFCDKRYKLDWSKQPAKIWIKEED